MCHVPEQMQYSGPAASLIREAASCPPRADLDGDMEKLRTEGYSPRLWVFYAEGNVSINNVALCISKCIKNMGIFILKYGEG